jgi:L-ascorbate metabolism protein UlaG (beta-lactamase superfamily)
MTGTGEERMRNVGRKLTMAALLLVLLAATASAQQVDVLWLGHATFRLTSVTGKVIVIDPFLVKNPRTPAKYKDLKAVGKVDLILLTHGHQDHIADLLDLAKLTGATVVANHELAHNLVALGMLPGGKTIPMNKGGMVTPLGAGIKVHMVPAEHSASADLLGLKSEVSGQRFISGGAPVGYVIEFETGFRIYHTGDTDVFTDMSLIHRFFKPDLALVCIGGHFTMDPERAAYAVRELIRPKQVIPMHYGTFPVINRTSGELKAALGDTSIRVLEMKPGDALKF